jgi:hypothetical protein
MVSPIVWKEWHEQRWKMVFGVVMMTSFFGAVAASRIMSAREAVVGGWIFGGLILSLYSAMGVFAPERVGGTLIFLASKPLDARKVFLWKWFFGWLNVIVPMVCCGLVALLIEGRQIGTWEYLVRRPLVGATFATSFYTIICCLAPRQAGEAQVGLFGLGVLLACLLHLVLFTSTWLVGSDWVLPLPLLILEAANPLYPLASLDPGQSWRTGVAVPVQVVVFALVMWVGCRKWQRSI